MQSVPYFCLILTTIRMYRQMLVNLPNVIFYEGPLSGSRVVTCGQTYRRMNRRWDVHDDTNT
jgi:hypothetical protein